MSSLKKQNIGQYIDILTDYHSNGSYETLRNNVTLLHHKEYAIMIRTLNFERQDFTDDLIYVDKKAYEFLSKSKLQPYDILINKIANPGSVYIMPDLGQPTTCGMNLFLIRFSKSVNQRYMYYCMKNSETYIKSLAHGTTTRTITKEEIRNISLQMHTNIEEQNKIEKILTSIDKKIQCNRKVNATLQQMAQTAYMHSFFNKKPNGVLGEIIIENPNSPIPVGDAKKSDGDIPFFTSGDAVLKWPDSLVDGRNCFLNTGGNAGIKFYVGDAAYSTDTWCITAKDNLADYMYLFIESIKAELYQKFFQGTGLKHLQKPLLKKRQIYIPTQTEIDNFNVKVQSWLTMVSENIQEINTLMNLRDWLLPMLMNGQIKVI